MRAERPMLPLVVITLAVGCAASAGCRDEPRASRARIHAAEVDHTSPNERDRGGALLTPADQGVDREDIAITADIRRRLMAHDGLSLGAKNVKIVTDHRRVTLRGPVHGDAEREAVLGAAREAAGVQQIVDELDVVHGDGTRL